ncbi:MAG: sulfite exporter TauE/SafE family protein [Planctomycetaceae bacterium]|nr:sulfite exporter TauE/SafE family protein [Planctomycetaceae bacterium]
MDLTAVLWIAFALSILLSSFVQSAMGFGYALVALVALTQFMGVREANLVVSFSAFVPIIYAAWMNRQELDRRLFGICVLFSALLMPIGLYVFETISADLLMRGTGVIILLLAVDGLREKADRAGSLGWNRFWAAVAGGASGFMTGAVSIGGPPIIIFAAKQKWSASQFKAFVTMFLLMLTFFKGAGVVIAGLLTKEILIMAAVSIPFGYIGGWLGDRTTRHIDKNQFRRIALMLLVAMSVLMIFRGSPGNS